MYLVNVRKIRVVYVICGTLIALMLSSCGKRSDYDVKQVSYVYSYGDQDGAELDVITSDGILKKYVIQPYSDSEIDLFEGEIPTENQCNISEHTISMEKWNSIVDMLNSNRFMELPEELPSVEANDGSSRYIEVVTSEGTHKVGGYCAGNGTGKEHQRFFEILKVLQESIF